MKLVAAVVFAALVAVGCSKGGAPSKEQYVAVANSVCGQAHNELLDKTKAHLATHPDGGANQRFVRAVVIARLKGMNGQLRSIQPPDREGPYLTTIYDDYDHALALRYSDPLGTTSKSATDAVGARMKSYGLTACETAGDIDLGGTNPG